MMSLGNFEKAKPASDLLPARWLCRYARAYHALGSGICKYAANKILELLLMTPTHKLQSTPCYILFESSRPTDYFFKSLIPDYNFVERLLSNAVKSIRRVEVDGESNGYMEEFQSILIRDGNAKLFGRVFRKAG